MRVPLDGCNVGLLAKAEPNELNREGAPILRDSGGKEINPFRFLSLGIMAYIGNDKAGTFRDTYTQRLAMEAH